MKRNHEVKHFVREWRQYRGLSVEKLAALAGLSGSMISQLERGKTTYTQTTLDKLATALNCQCWQLLASGPAENQKLWDTVLAVTLQQLIMNNCEAVLSDGAWVRSKLREEGWRESEKLD